MYTASNTLIYSIFIIIQLREQRCGLAHILSVETNVCSVRVFDVLQVWAIQFGASLADKV